MEDKRLKRIINGIKSGALENRWPGKAQDKLANELISRADKTGDPHDYFIYAYFTYAMQKINEPKVITNHWNFFSQGWFASPFLMNTLEKKSNSDRVRLKMLRYLEVFVIPSRLWEEAFSRDERAIISSEKFQPPNFLVKEISSIIKAVSQENSRVGRKAKKLRLRAAKLLLGERNRD